MKGTVLVLSTVLLLTSCVVLEERKPGPPPWAPAHGYRAKHIYYYYPAAAVYFDVNRKVYFFLDDGTWRVAATLPPVIVVDPAQYVVLELDTDRPYIYHDQHKAQYPPGKLKK